MRLVNLKIVAHYKESAFRGHPIESLGNTPHGQNIETSSSYYS